MEEIVEIFGKRLKVVTDENGSCCYCKLCDIRSYCGNTASGTPVCENTKGNVNRHFEEVKD